MSTSNCIDKQSWLTQLYIEQQRIDWIRNQVNFESLQFGRHQEEAMIFHGLVYYVLFVIVIIVVYAIYREIQVKRMFREQLPQLKNRHTVDQV